MCVHIWYWCCCLSIWILLDYVLRTKTLQLKWAKSSIFFSIIVCTILSELCSNYYMQSKKYSTPTTSRSLFVELEIRTRFGINIQVMAKKEKVSHACGKAKYQYVSLWVWKYMLCASECVASIAVECVTGGTGDAGSFFYSSWERLRTWKLSALCLETIHVFPGSPWKAPRYHKSSASF